MDKVQTISRRAALIGATVSSVALAVPVAAAVTVEAEGEHPPINIEQLAEQFHDAARALDPRINLCMIGYDETAKGPRDMRVMSLYLGRLDAAFVPQPRRASITDLFPQWVEARAHVAETEEQGVERYARYVDLQAKITALRPQSVREVAMQLVVETDDGESDYRPAFFQRLRYIAMES